MTLGVAWVRVVGATRELIVASDSRLSGGQYWDANPKIMLLPRTDSVLSFAGSTHDAYPLMLQAYNAIKMHPPAENGALDIAELKGHLVRVFNYSREFISGLPRGQSEPDDPDALFMLSGYSWRTKKFDIWKLHFDRSLSEFTFRPTTEWSGQEPDAYKLIAWVGDEAPIAEARRRLIEVLRSRNKLASSSLDMEPFEVLRDVIRGKTFPSVGGSIQVVKVYEHANVAPVGVYWPDKASGQRCLFGRALLDYEKLRWGILDPDDPTKIGPVIRPEEE